VPATDEAERSPPRLRIWRNRKQSIGQDIIETRGKTRGDTSQRKMKRNASKTSKTSKASKASKARKLNKSPKAGKAASKKKVTKT
jgi:hypothetical protein